MAVIHSAAESNMLRKDEIIQNQPSELIKTGIEIFKLNNKASEQKVISSSTPDELSLSIRAALDSQAGEAGNISLNEKIAMCSSMIGYCHYLEAASSSIGFPQDEIQDITRVRNRIEKRLKDYSP